MQRFANRAHRRAAIADMKTTSQQYPVGQLVEIAREDWPDVWTPPGIQRVWRDRRYLVQQYLDRGMTRLSVSLGTISNGSRTSAAIAMPAPSSSIRPKQRS